MSVFDDVSDPSEAKETHGNTRDWSFYQNLRRTDPRGYYKPKIQSQMVADRQRLGRDKFFAKNSGGNDA